MEDDRIGGASLFTCIVGLTGVAGSYAAVGYSPRFVVAPIDAVVVRLSPAGVVAWMIQNVGEEAHLLHVGLSIGIAAGLFAIAAFAGLLVAGRQRRPVVGPILAGLLVAAATITITGNLPSAMGAAIPVAAFTGLARLPEDSLDHDPSGRRSLLAGAGAFVLVGLGLGARQLRSGGDETSEESTTEISAAVEARLREADARSLDFEADDIPGLVSPIDEFYNVDIAEFPPEIREDEWSLAITGTSGEAVTVEFSDLMELPIEHRFMTIRCVSDELNGRLLDTAVWTGTPMGQLLDGVDPRGRCDCVVLRAEDDYFVEIPVEALRGAFLVWGMNGQPLPVDHGYPVRVLVPGRWGETNVKWLSEIELLEEPMDGYWENRGWHGTGAVTTIAKLWGRTTLDDGRAELGGHAYAGTRGLDRVEVSVDGGESWETAMLSEPLPGEDVWRQWRYRFEPAGTHDVVVRAVDGTGTVQPREQADPFPRGASGWVTERIEF